MFSFEPDSSREPWQEAMDLSIRSYMLRFHKLVDTVVQEALWKRVENGWKAEPVIYTFAHEPLRKSVRIVENGEIVFQQDVVLRLPSY